MTVWVMIISAYVALPGNPDTYFQRFTGPDAEQHCSAALQKKMESLRGLPAVIGRCTTERNTREGVGV